MSLQRNERGNTAGVQKEWYLCISLAWPHPLGKKEVWSKRLFST